MIYLMTMVTDMTGDEDDLHDESDNDCHDEGNGDGDCDGDGDAAAAGEDVAAIAAALEDNGDWNHVVRRVETTKTTLMLMLMPMLMLMLMLLLMAGSWRCGGLLIRGVAADTLHV